MAPAPLRGVVMHRAFLLAMRASKAGSRSMGQLEINFCGRSPPPRPKQSKGCQSEESLVMSCYVQRGLKLGVIFGINSSP